MLPIVAIATAVIGLAIIAVLVSKQSNTSGVIGSLSSGFSQIIGAAVGPVGGGTNTGGFSPFSTSGWIG